MPDWIRLTGPAALSILAVATGGAAPDQVTPSTQTRTQVVLLGTGTPPADPDRSGPATAIVVNDTPYLVDAGAGVVRRAKSAVVDRGVSRRGSSAAACRSRSTGRPASRP